MDVAVAVWEMEEEVISVAVVVTGELVGTEWRVDAVGIEGIAVGARTEEEEAVVHHADQVFRLQHAPGKE